MTSIFKTIKLSVLYCQKKISELLDSGRKIEIKIHSIMHLQGKENARISIFAHFDRDNVIDDYVVFYIQQLNKIGVDIVFVSASDLNEGEITKVREYCVDIITKENIGYDFGSWKVGLDYLGERLFEYDELILCNDSVYAPLYDLSEMFDVMGGRGCDFWGITDNIEFNYHIQSYFMVFSKKLFSSDIFNSFWANLKVYKYKKHIIRNYELALSQKLLKNGCKLDVYISYRCFKESKVFNTTINHYRELIVDYRAPVLKIELLRDNPLDLDLGTWEKVISENSSYNITLIKKHLKRIQQ